MTLPAHGPTTSADTFPTTHRPATAAADPVVCSTNTLSATRYTKSPMLDTPMPVSRMVVHRRCPFTGLLPLRRGRLRVPPHNRSHIAIHSSTVMAATRSSFISMSKQMRTRSGAVRTKADTAATW